MAITLSNTSVNEATDGIQIGTLSTDQGSGTFSLYFSNHSNFLTLSGTTLSLKSGWFLDFESKYFESVHEYFLRCRSLCLSTILAYQPQARTLIFPRLQFLILVEKGLCIDK